MPHKQILLKREHYMSSCLYQFARHNFLWCIITIFYTVTEFYLSVFLWTPHGINIYIPWINGTKYSYINVTLNIYNCVYEKPSIQLLVWHDYILLCLHTTWKWQCKQLTLIITSDWFPHHLWDCITSGGTVLNALLILLYGEFPDRPI